jgi:hypothetical protein
MSASVMTQDGRDKRVKKSVLVLALVAAVIYVGFILWGLMHGLK